MPFDPSKATATPPSVKFGDLDVRSSLAVEKPAQGNPHGTYNHDRLVLVPINQIDRYEDNPRRRRNKDEWIAFKESVRSVHIKQPIKITQKPGSSRYQIIEGGNSRHAALEELFAETGDEKFSVIPTLFQAWDDEAFQSVNVLLAHIIENEMRSEVLFWDKAQAYCHAADLLGIAEESARNISDSFKQKGAAVSHSKIAEFVFANNKLRELGQLCYDLSGSKVIELRKTYNDLLKLIETKPDDFSEFWESTLDAYAGTQSTDNEVEPTLNITSLIKYIKQAFFERFPEAASALIQKTSRLPSTDNNKQSTGATDVSQKTETEGNDSNGQKDVVSDAAEQGLGFEDSNASLGQDFGSTDGSNANDATSIQNWVASIQNDSVNLDDKTLHEQIMDLLNHCHIGHLFREIPASPFQFYIELPEFTSEEQYDGEYYPLDAIHQDARDVWWLLANISNQLDVTNDVFMTIPNESFFMQTFMDTAIWQGYVKSHLGEATPFALENWLTYGGDETLISLLLAVLKQIRIIHNEMNFGS